MVCCRSPTGFASLRASHSLRLPSGSSREKHTKNMTNINAKLDPWLIIILGSVLFMPFLGGVNLFDWDEVNFAECAREMIRTGDYSRLYIDYQPFWEKPPLFIWLQVASMKLFGISAYTARFPNAVFGVLTLLMIYFVGRRAYDRRFGWWWVAAYTGSILPHLYAKSGIIDPVFNFFIFGSLAGLVWFVWRKDGSYPAANRRTNYWPLIGGGAMLGLALLTKGPVAILIVGLTMGVYWLGQRCRFFITPLQAIVFFGVSLLVGGSWFLWDIVQHGTWFTTTFITYQIRLFSTHDAGHVGFWGYHFVVLLFGCFPASVFAFRAFFERAEQQPHQSDLTLWMKILFWVVLILFTVVQSKIVHYSSMCYLPLTYLGALSLYRMERSNRALPVRYQWLMFGIGGLVAVAAAALPILGMDISQLKTWLAADAFAVAALDAQVSWSLVQMGAGIWLAATIVCWKFGFRNVGFRMRNIGLLAGTAIFVQLALVQLVGSIEAYSQRAAIDFYQTLRGRDCYVQTIGFKSFAHLFYSDKMPGGDTLAQNRDWILHADTRKPTYIVAKVNQEKSLSEEPTLKLLYRKNGFVFYERLGLPSLGSNKTNDMD